MTTRTRTSKNAGGGWVSTSFDEEDIWRIAEIMRP
jgi:hypothetical protein